jgi:hypothetical protein
MLKFDDYGDDGVVPVVRSQNVESVVDNILEYVQSRFEILELKDRREDILALCQEFDEWGTAGPGDDIEYYTCPTFK